MTVDDASLAYQGVADAWAAGAAPLYDRLAVLLVDQLPGPLSGSAVLDIGAGTGAVSRALVQRGAVPFAVDSAPDMIDRCRTAGLHGVVADMLALPFGNGAYDHAVAAFSVSHVDDPVRAVSEARRVVRPAGTVVAGVFAAAAPNRSKRAIDAVAEEFGYVPPPWYLHFKRDLEPLTNTAPAFRDVARRAGLADVSTQELTVETGVNASADIVGSRLGMAHMAPWVASLAPARRSALVEAAVNAVARDPEPLRPTVVVMSGRVGA